MPSKDITVTVNDLITATGQKMCRVVADQLGKVKCWLVLIDPPKMFMYAAPLPQRHADATLYILYDNGQYKGAFSPVPETPMATFDAACRALWGD